MPTAKSVKDPGIPENAYLVINNQVVPIRRRETTIGRKLSNYLVIQDVLVSREHAKIVYKDGQFVVYDLGSTGGTSINNKTVEQATLHNRDVLGFANVSVTFMHDVSDMEDQAGKRTGSLK